MHARNTSCIMVSEAVALMKGGRGTRTHRPEHGWPWMLPQSFRPVRFTGLAVSAGGLAPRELPLIRTPVSMTEVAEEVLAAARAEEASTIVIGLPVTRRCGIMRRMPPPPLPPSRQTPRASGSDTKPPSFTRLRSLLTFPLVASLCQRGSIWDEETDSQQGRRCRNFAITVAGCARAAGLGDLYIVLYGADPNVTSSEKGGRGGMRGGVVHIHKGEVGMRIQEGPAA